GPPTLRSSTSASSRTRRTAIPRHFRLQASTPSSRSCSCGVGASRQFLRTRHQAESRDCQAEDTQSIPPTEQTDRRCDRQYHEQRRLNELRSSPLPEFLNVLAKAVPVGCDLHISVCES